MIFFLHIGINSYPLLSDENKALFEDQREDTVVEKTHENAQVPGLTWLYQQSRNHKGDQYNDDRNHGYKTRTIFFSKVHYPSKEY